MITNSKGQVVASFVEVDNVRITAAYYTETDCSSTFDPVNGGAQYTTSGTKCDITANIYSSATNSCTSATDPGCWFRIHTEFDHDWQGAGYCGPSTVCDPILAQSQIAAQSTYIDVQGFVFWDPNHVTDQWHSFSGWELHALTAWRFHQSSSQADFGISANPTSVTVAVNSAGTSTITVSPVNGFTGSVALKSNNSACTLSPMTLSGGSGTSSLACTFNTAGTVTVVVTGTSGSFSHSAAIAYTITNGPDFVISASPSVLSIVQGSSGKSTITLVSLNGFAGSVSLSSTVSTAGPGPTVTLNPSSVSLGAGGSASSTLTISTASAVPTGSYTVTVTGTSGRVSHSAVVSVTVTSPSSQGDFTISVNPSSLSISRSSSGTSVITLTSVSGFSGSVSLSARVSSSRIHLSMSPNSLTLSSGGSATANLIISANHKVIPGSYTVTVTATSGSITHSAIITLTIT